MQIVSYNTLVALVNEIRAHSYRAIVDVIEGHVDDTIVQTESGYEITSGSGELAVVIVYYNNNGNYKLGFIPYSKINTITAGDGISYKDTILSIVINADSTNYLTLSKEGLSVKKLLDFIEDTSKKSGLFNINTVLGVDTVYTLESAIQALKDMNTEVQEGFIFTFKTSDGWGTYQFITGDYNTPASWKKFGAGTEASDSPEENGKLAFSTGGAFKRIPFTLNSYYNEESKTTDVWLQNEKGEQIGTKITVKGGGGGGETTTDFEFLFKTTSLNVKSGDSVVAEAFIRSTTTSSVLGTVAQTITKVEIYDESTNTLLKTVELNRASSVNQYDFKFDLSEYATTVGVARSFKFKAYDALGRSKESPILTVLVVDVTIESCNLLHFTNNTVLYTDTDSVQIPLYRYPKATTSIRTTVKIYVNSNWYQIGQVTQAVPTSTQYFTLNRKLTLNGVQRALTHGAYLLSVHGEAILDNGNTVSGNYLYTTVFVVDKNSSVPLLATEWLANPSGNETIGVVKRYESIEFKYAAYSKDSEELQVSINDSTGALKELSNRKIEREEVGRFVYQIVESSNGSLIKRFNVSHESDYSPDVEYQVDGTLIDVEAVTALQAIDLEMDGRTNSDILGGITANGFELKIVDCNQNSNGFVTDDSGKTSLKFSDEMTGTLNYHPFSSTNIAGVGMALEMKLKISSVADETYDLVQCALNGTGFKINGKQLLFSSRLETADANMLIKQDIPLDTVFDITMLIEPMTIAPYSGIGVMKLYLDGELVGSCSYSNIYSHNQDIIFDSKEGTVQLYYLKGWATYFDYIKNFHHYLLKLASASDMVAEFEKNDVFSSQEAEQVTKLRPQRDELYSRGIPYMVLCKSNTTGTADSDYPPYIEGLKGDKKTTVLADVYMYFPDRPWADFYAHDVLCNNQGTTSSGRPIKNIRMKFKKSETGFVRLLHEESEFTGKELELYKKAAKAAAKRRVAVYDNSKPTNKITVKVDYSDSSGANNGASCQLFNELQIALGSNYMTPAQNANTDTSFILNTSVASRTMALFRTDKYSKDPTSPNYGYFHAKANLNEDKGDESVFGFEDIEGYNKGCLNYGDFYELIASKNQSLENFLQTQDKTQWEFPDPNDETGATNYNVVVLSEYCGPNHKVFRRENSEAEWQETTGRMSYKNGQWTIEGDVVNPVECYELLKYDYLDWFQGVNTVEDMMTLDGDGKPIWLQYYESRYPDDDYLNKAYEDGRKVPYRLYKWLAWCQQCNHNLTASDGTITLNDNRVNGTPANRTLKFKQELYKEANPYSMLCYHLYTDYMACVDQRSKNMMLAFYLDQTNLVRAYLNHYYDGDCCVGYDNDCGLTIEDDTDPDAPADSNDYQGRDSVLFCQLSKLKKEFDTNSGQNYAGSVWVSADAETNPSSNNTLNLDTVALAMRRTKNPAGQELFSKVGIERLWVTERLGLWPKTVSSYDGLRKYVETAVAGDSYFYAIHGLAIQRLRRFIDNRFRFRDDYYGINTYISYAVKFRLATGTGMGSPKIKVTAGKNGMFGIGVDSVNSATERKFLKTGESYVFDTKVSENVGTMVYVFGSDRLAELDLCGAVVAEQGLAIVDCPILRKITFGADRIVIPNWSGTPASAFDFTNMPFLQEIDMHNLSVVKNISCDSSRLLKLNALGTQLSEFTVASAAKIEKLLLPETLTTIKLYNLPRLKYPSGFTISSLRNINTLVLQSNPGIDEFKLLQDIITAGATLKYIKLTEVDRTAPATILTTLKSMGTLGYQGSSNSTCQGISGRWVLTTLLEDDEFRALQEYYPNLKLHNAQYTGIVQDDKNTDGYNLTNLDNETSGHSYECSGHFLRIINRRVPVIGKVLVEGSGIWKGKKLNTQDYTMLLNGTDITDLMNQGYDVMMLFKGFYYKGVNDFKNAKKYTFVSSQDYEPISTASSTKKVEMSSIQYRTGYAVYPGQATVNETVIDDILYSGPTYNTYKVDCSTYKQVRWTGVSNNTIGAVFLDENNIVVSTFKFYDTTTDFVSGDYLFTNVPEGAKWFVFSCLATVSDKVILTDSKEVEAIEPDWVKAEDFLLGIYKGSMSEYGLRSIGNRATVVVGTGGTQIGGSDGWNYVKNNPMYPLNLPSGLDYVALDLLNTAFYRGKGYQAVDYEASKIYAMLVQAYSGARDALEVFGSSAGSTTGILDSYSNTKGMSDTKRSVNDSYGQKILGIENPCAGASEFMAYMISNAASYKSFITRHASTAADKVDTVYKIYDPYTETERSVQGLVAGSGVNILRVKHGRYCDIIPSKLGTTNYDTGYTDRYASGVSVCSIPARSGYGNSNSNGLCFMESVTYGGGSYQYSTRLMFRGKIEIED